MSDLFINIIFVILTGLIAIHGLTFRNKDGEKDFGRLLFGCISFLFFLRVLFFDLLDLF